MFRRKPKEASPQSDAPRAAPRASSGGYEVTELPTFHGRNRKVVVYTSDGSGKIIKTFKK
ncbi:MAG TPA: hypothetical protein VGV86_08720 [Acidimicrobiales bacterium]|nr:hypothetical protein [Acidimicrobiales bacterium]